MSVVDDPTEPLERARQIPAWTLEVRESSGRVRLLDLVCGQTLRVGSSPHNELTLKDPAVSRGHLELRAEPGGLRVCDLGSTNGTTVQGVRVVEALLEGPGVIRVGSTSVRAQLGERVAAPEQFGALVGRSAAMRGAFKLLQRAAQSDATVLLQAESGCGKELAARSLHSQGPRRGGPYVVFDCGAAAPGLLESALFGHERGAFTGATSARAGCFEEAYGGTLLLDELGELPLEQQTRLLRVLETRQVRRVGGTAPIDVDVRVVAATHRHLGQEVNRGAFREDLYYRLAVVQVTLPPLRERLDDLPLLLEHLLRQAVAEEAQVRGHLARLDEAAWQALRAHPWKGNARELRNAVDRAVALDEVVRPPSSDAPPPRPAAPDGLFLEQKQRVLDEFERGYLSAMLDRHQGNLSRAAANAGIDRMYFKRLLKKHGLT